MITFESMVHILKLQELCKLRREIEEEQKEEKTKDVLYDPDELFIGSESDVTEKSMTLDEILDAGTKVVVDDDLDSQGKKKPKEKKRRTDVSVDMNDVRPPTPDLPKKPLKSQYQKTFGEDTKTLNKRIKQKIKEKKKEEGKRTPEAIPEHKLPPGMATPVDPMSNTQPQVVANMEDTNLEEQKAQAEELANAEK